MTSSTGTARQAVRRPGAGKRGRPRLALPKFDVGASAALFADFDGPESKRDLMLAALESFAKLRFHGTTTRIIAQRAGMSAAALYQHYKSKEDLLYDLSVVVAEALLAELQAVTVRKPKARLAELVRVHVCFHATMLMAVEVTNHEMYALSGPQRSRLIVIRDRIERIFDDCLAEGLKAGDFRVADPRLITILILSIGMSVSRWFRAGGRLDADELARFYSDRVMRMV